ncbi:MAG TPA: bifunctional hydroxymethylpyrimidine kinase/phosphomethylpyrimidine kinase [Corynebacteriales bacterium]|nr:bifunctional hydroxymethylpyrimidine kinase/phosphomethylpyrimidine kinase [Mycobacteriales bacterium]
MPRVLSIAGTDPSGGAGLQADLKSIAAAGGYGMGVVTALVAQNTCGVRSVHTPPLEFLRDQLAAVTDDVAIDAVKIGMLGDPEITAVVHDWLVETKPPVVVLDPVMVATSGDRLLSADAEEAMRELVVTTGEVADIGVITPNIPELAVLVKESPVETIEEAVKQGEQLLESTKAAVLVKGGHLSNQTLTDYLLRHDHEPEHFLHPLVDTKNTHGTGCSLSAGLATRIAQSGDVVKASQLSIDWLYGAILHADLLEVGKGHGPVFHGWETAPCCQ